MTMQYSVTVRNNQLDQVEVTAGVSARLQLRSGVPPANCAAADTGVLLAELLLPADYMSNAAAGSKAKLGVWSGAGVAAGVVGHFRLKDTTAATTHIQGTVTATGGGGDMTLDNTNIAVNQTVTVNSFTINAGNA